MKKLFAILITAILLVGALLLFASCGLDCEHEWVYEYQFVETPSCVTEGLLQEYKLCRKCNVYDGDYVGGTMTTDVDPDSHWRIRDFKEPNPDEPWYLDNVYRCADCGVEIDRWGYHDEINQDYECPPHVDINGNGYCYFCDADIEVVNCPGHEVDEYNYCIHCGTYVPPPPTITNVYFRDEDYAKVLGKGESYKYEVHWYPEDLEAEFFFTTTDSDIITVSDDGTVTVIGDGVARLTVTYKDNENINATISIYCGDFAPEFIFKEIQPWQSVLGYTDGWLIDGISSAVPKVVTIPAVYQGKPVIGIDNQAFNALDNSGYANIEKIVIPEGILMVGQYAICNLPNLTELVIPDSIEYVSAFSVTDCPSLNYYEDDTGYYLGNESNNYLALISGKDGITNFVANPGTRIIPDQIFAGNTDLVSVDLGSVVSIGWEAFRGTSITSVVIPDTVKSINSEAFRGCNSIEYISIGKNVKNIGSYAFIECPSVTELYFNAANMDDVLGGNGVFAFGTGDSSEVNVKATVKVGPDVVRLPNLVFGGLYVYADLTVDMSEATSLTEIGERSFRCISTTIKNIDIPEQVTTIGKYAFEDNYALTTIHIPENVTTLGEGAFRGCNYVENIIYDAKNLSGDQFKAAMPGNWYTASNLVTITVSPRVTSIPANFFKNVMTATNTSSDTTLKLEIRSNSTISIGDYAFEGAPLVRVNINASDPTIGKGAFRNCAKLSEIILPICASIGDEAFMNTAITEISFPDVIGDFGKNVFKGCKNLTSIDIHLNYSDTIPVGIFDGCTSLSVINIYGSPLAIGDRAFAGTAINHIALPASVITFGSGIFDGCASLEYVVLPKGMTKIPAGLFAGCTGLTEIDLSGITEIGARAFEGTGLVEVTLPETLKSIGTNAFSGCKKLATINHNAKLLASNNNEIVFDGIGTETDGVTVNIGAEVSHISQKLFYSTTSNITKIVFSESGKLTSIYDYAFFGLKNVKKLYLPSSVTYMAKYAFGDMTGVEELGVHIVQGISMNGTSFNNVGTATEGTTLYIGEQSKSIINAFESAKITDIVFVDGCQIVEISTNVFNTLKSLSSVTLHEGLKTIDLSFFAGTSITELNIPSTVTSIKAPRYIVVNAQTVPKIVNFNLHADNTSFAIVDGVIYTKDMKALVWYPAYREGKAFTVPSSVTSIFEGGFAFARKLETVVLPDSITELPNYCFYAANYLSSINLDKVTVLGKYCFSYTAIDDFVTPSGMLVVGDYAFYKSNVRTVKITSNVKEIGDYAFWGSTVFTLEIEEGLERIGSYAFYNNESIGGVRVEETVMTPVIIPASVKTIGTNAFGYNPNDYPPEFSNSGYVPPKAQISVVKDYEGAWYDSHCIVTKRSA